MPLRSDGTCNIPMTSLPFFFSLFFHPLYTMTPALTIADSAYLQIRAY